MPNAAGRAGTPAGVFGAELRYYLGEIDVGVEGVLIDDPRVLRITITDCGRGAFPFEKSAARNCAGRFRGNVRPVGLLLAEAGGAPIISDGEALVQLRDRRDYRHPGRYRARRPSGRDRRSILRDLR